MNSSFEKNWNVNVIKLCRLVMSGIACKAKMGATRLRREEVALTVEELVTGQESVLPIGEMVARVDLLPTVEAWMAVAWAHARSGALAT